LYAEESQNSGLLGVEHNRCRYIAVNKGTFGRVRLVKHKQTNKFFAAKILKKIEILKSKQIDHVQNESQILSELGHPFIVVH
jgi:serine/threonine protein kinase